MGPPASFILPVRRLAGYLCRRQDKQRSFSSWRVLRNRSFRSYFVGCVTSDFGTWLQNTAQVLLAYRLTHSPLAVGLVTCAQFSSPLVLGPWAGVMTDRFGSRQTLLATQVAAALIAVWLAVLDFSGVLNERWLVTGAITTGLAFTFALPARNVTVRRLVPEAETESAFAMDSVSYNLGRATAPPLSVLLVDTLGFGWAFAANAISFLVFAAFLVLAGRGSAEPRSRKDRSKLRDGFVIAIKEPRIMILLLMVAAVTIADDPVLVLGPTLASHFHVSASWSGWFIAALGGGTVLGSLRPARRKPSLRLAAIALAALVLCMLLFVLAPWVWGSFAAALGAGITCLIANSATRTLLARQAGEKREASVMAVWAIAWAGSKPLASLADGLLASRVGVQWTGVLLILPALALILAVILWSVLGRRLAAPSQRPALTIAEKTADEGVSSEGSRGSPSG
jgi:MFS family permease